MDIQKHKETGINNEFLEKVIITKLIKKLIACYYRVGLFPCSQEPPL